MTRLAKRKFELDKLLLGGESLKKCNRLPCRWSNDTIVVLDEVLIQPPYDVDSCKANSSSASSLARVKKVVRCENQTHYSYENH